MPVQKFLIPKLLRLTNLCVGFAMLVAGAAIASGTAPYTLTAGDRIQINHVGLDAPVMAVIDVDGNVRLDGVKPVRVAGSTLDEAADALVAGMQADDIFIVTRVDIALLDYAPIVVAGDVQFPQRIDFTPGMTISSAVGAAGGLRAGALTRLDATRLWAELDGQMKAYGLSVLSQSLVVARTRAALNGTEAVALNRPALSWLPRSVLARLPEQLAAQQAVLQADLARLKEVSKTWQREVASIEKHIAVLDARQDVLQELADMAASELVAAEQLQSRGLQTSTRLVTVRTQEANARSDLLELQSMRLTAMTVLAQTKQRRAQFLTQRRADLTAELDAALATRAAAQISYDKVRAQLAQLPFSPGAINQGETTLGVSYDIQTARPNRARPAVIEKDTALLPGDTLIVSLHFGASGSVPVGN